MRPVRPVLPRLLEPVVPARLGRSFRWLLSAAVIENAGDGVALAAGPLLVASLTRDPFLVSLAVMTQYLPMLLFGVIGGAAADRLDRKRMVVVANVFRADCRRPARGHDRDRDREHRRRPDRPVRPRAPRRRSPTPRAARCCLGWWRARTSAIANARMQGAFLLTNQLVAPPIGAFLFAAGMALPFAANAAAFALSAVLITRVVASTREAVAERPGFVSEMVEGIRWLVAHPPMRTLALTIFLFNVTFGAAWAVLVLYAGDRLGMDAVGFGLITTASAIGGIIGVSSYGRLERRFSLGDIMRVGLADRDGHPPRSWR